MSDSDASNDDDVSLPRATVYKLVTELLPPDVHCTRETRELLLTCCVEFVHLLASAANEVCEQGSRKTISPEHIVAALNTLGFGSYAEECKDLATDHKKQLKARERKGSRFNQMGLSEEELRRQQAALFEASRKKYEAGLSSPTAAGMSAGASGSGYTSPPLLRSPHVETAPAAAGQGMAGFFPPAPSVPGNPDAAGGDDAEELPAFAGSVFGGMMQH